MIRCFYCGDEGHAAVDCKHKHEDRSGNTRKRRIKKWGYMPVEELMAALTKHFFVPKRLSWLVYFFRYSHIEELLTTGFQSEVLAASKDIYSDPEYIETQRLLKMGQEKFKEGAYQQALVILELVLQKNPNDYRSHITKAYAHIERSELDQALASLESATEAAPADYYRSLAWLLTARVNHCDRKLDSAIMYAQKAGCSQLSEANYLLAILYVEKGLVDEGIAQLQLAIEENREYLVASCYEPAFSHIEPELNFLLDNIIQMKKKRVDHQLQKVLIESKQVKNLEAELFDPLDFKNARLKYAMAKRKFETDSYFGYLDANRLANEAAAYLKTAKLSSVARKRVALTRLTEYVKLSLKSGILYGVCAAGWGLVIGGGIGILLALKHGPQNEYKIFTSAIKGATIGFLAIYVYNWRITHYRQKFFLNRFAKRFRRERGYQKNPK
jgi:tetratricopeptide (TPR) repeat protein